MTRTADPAKNGGVPNRSTPTAQTDGPRPDARPPGPDRTADALATHHPALLPPYRDALPAARAAILARLWGALSREPVAGVHGRETRDGRTTLTLTDGRRLRGPADAAAPFAVADAGLTIHLDERPHQDPATLLAACGLPGGYADEVANSVANLALARAGQPLPDPSTGTRTEPVAGWESLVVDGHPLHPGCRTRAGMSTAEVLAYAPEHRMTVDLRLVEVPADRWFTTGTGLPPLLPVHPWQHEHVLHAYPWLRDTGRLVPARPLMSLRTLAVVADPGRHLKTAVDVQMTSAVRTVSAAAVRNGPPVTALLAGLARRAGGLVVLPEPAAGAVLVDGEPCRSLAVVDRRCPPPPSGHTVLPFAVLTVPARAGRPLVAAVVTGGYRGDPMAYLADLVRTLLPAPLALLRLGVALEAHGQNLLLVLRGQRPVGLRYRDVGGIRVSPARLRAHGVAVPALHGDLASDDPRELRDTLLASLGTVLQEQVAVLARVYGVDPHDLWRTVGTVAREVTAGSAGDGDTAALFAATLPVKATTAMRLAADPLDVIWARLPNPLAGAGGRR